MKKLLPSFILSLTPLLAFPTSVLAQTSSEPSLEQTIHSYSWTSILISTLIIAFVVLLTFIIKNETGLQKKLFFALIVIPTLFTTVYLFASTIYLNVNSSTGGPVHWHADFEIWNCNKKVDLVNPTGFSNKIGTPTLHEHNDDRIHVEGVVLKKEDTKFSNFIKVIGGKITTDKLELPTTEGKLVLEEAGFCPDGTYGELQAFLYKVEGKNIGRSKFTDMNELADHILAPHSNVPPGDCIIIEFGEYKEKTDHICTFYNTAIRQGKFSGL